MVTLDSRGKQNHHSVSNSHYVGRYYYFKRLREESGNQHRYYSCAVDQAVCVSSRLIESGEHGHYHDNPAGEEMDDPPAIPT